MVLLGVGGGGEAPSPLALARGSAGGGAIFHDKAKKCQRHNETPITDIPAPF